MTKNIVQITFFLLILLQKSFAQETGENYTNYEELSSGNAYSIPEKNSDETYSAKPSGSYNSGYESRNNQKSGEDFQNKYDTNSQENYYSSDKKLQNSQSRREDPKYLEENTLERQKIVKKSENNSIENRKSQPKNTIKNNIFEDNMGDGYRVYDNSNRQSYFCSKDKNHKPAFKHEDNFNGVYVGIGFQSTNISGDLDFVDNSPFVSGQKLSSFKENVSGSSATPSLIIGHGRLFSNGLYLGQEFSLNIGDTELKNKKLKSNAYEVEKISITSSNFSSYSGKFGVNIFKNFLPYVKLGLSMSPTRFVFTDSNDYKNVAYGEGFIFGVGAGLDISFAENVRAIIDYTTYSDSASLDVLGIYGNGNTYKYNQKIDASFSTTRASLLWKF